ncbi:hypothetical protein [Nostoc sp. MG11]
MLDGVLYQLKNDCNWCDLPKSIYWWYDIFLNYF